MAAAERKVTILFIQASPPAWTRLDVNEEMRGLQMALGSARYRDRFDWRPLPAARVGELLPALRQHAPDVVHFAGHGDGHGGLVLNAEDTADEHILPADQWAEALRIYQPGAARPVRLVVLAGCNTAPAAELAAQHVDCAVGMADRVGDEAMAKAFTPALYRSLADGSSIHEAVEAARWQMRNCGLRGAEDDAEAVKLYVRPGVDARALKLTELAPAKPEISQAHAKYLQALFKQRWAKVKMNLFDPDAAQDVNLLEIYSPLPVDFAISLELDEQGGVKDWWCAGCRSEREGRAEPEPWEGVLVEPGDRRALAEAMQEHKARPRAWTDLRADEHALQPLLEIARSQARKQKSEAREFRALLREKSTFRWQAEAEHAALVQRRFVLVGDPGSGKSTFLRHLALSWAAHLLRETGQTRAPTDARLDVETGWPGPNFTPVYIELRPLIETFPPLPPDEDPPDLPGLETFETYLAGQLKTMGCETFYDDLIAMLADGRGAILLDGLDEVNDADDHRRRRQVQAFVATLQ
ncbi:MAG: CHAT domain-containing protein, partial [Anaerolineae bacterium]